MGGGVSKSSPEAMADAKAFVEKTINENKVVVFSKTYCPYCTKAKRALAVEIDLSKVLIIELENRPDCDAVQDALLQLTGGRSVPRVFINGKFIGGGDDTAHLQSTGQLRKLLQEAGAL